MMDATMQDLDGQSSQGAGRRFILTLKVMIMGALILKTSYNSLIIEQKNISQKLISIILTSKKIK
jgi:hypothetical protein